MNFLPYISKFSAEKRGEGEHVSRKTPTALDNRFCNVKRFKTEGNVLLWGSPSQTSYAHVYMIHWTGYQTSELTVCYKWAPVTIDFPNTRAMETLKVNFKDWISLFTIYFRTVLNYKNKWKIHAFSFRNTGCLRLICLIKKMVSKIIIYVCNAELKIYTYIWFMYVYVHVYMFTYDTKYYMKVILYEYYMKTLHDTFDFHIIRYLITWN